jgi:hypothetical protein
VGLGIAIVEQPALRIRKPNGAEAESDEGDQRET